MSKLVQRQVQESDATIGGESIKKICWSQTAKLDTKLVHRPIKPQPLEFSARHKLFSPFLDKNHLYPVSFLHVNT